MIRLSKVLLIFPKSVLFISRELGTEKLVWLKTLKASSLSSTPNRSLNLVRLISAVSMFQYPGPSTGVRVKLPKLPAVGVVKKAELALPSEPIKAGSTTSGRPVVGLKKSPTCPCSWARVRVVLGVMPWERADRLIVPRYCVWVPEQFPGVQEPA